ncbi:HDOD domain-containing protein [Psychrobium sp. 1_MG-2023]|uniref:HDOD domain-containing protein n=1 Tax=Psychrobium sp. 1_MG-2023 TaxID=3062624 RepID=UPI000C34C617|nr:HDOD domain-containing protein [Psychrobium sp. 1_MG-2023]MDP2561436.1 HDOD domain-containing protein [Psychrobium sp. 1_MG-2023]PKF57703.1 hypothetical protein CW748_05785 [Alteromonadales bacterium alter-6D02]
MDSSHLVNEIKSLPSLPQAYHKCSHLLEQESTDSAALAEVVSADPAMTLSVLKLVNSAYFNLPRRIERLEHAISIIGRDKFKELVLTAALVEAVSKLAGGEVKMEVFWRHSIYTGLIAKRLALHCYLPNSERLFISGLLHDIGQLLYFTIQPTKALKVSALVLKYGIETNLAESKVLGYNHQQLGAKLCQSWELPDWLTHTVSHHHQPQQKQRHQLESQIIYLANIIASSVYPSLVTLGHEKKIKPACVIEDPVWQALNIKPEVAKTLELEAEGQLNDILKSLIPDLRTVA